MSLLLAATALLHPQLVRGMPWRFGHDCLEYAVPHATYFFRELASGRLPLWNPFHDGGAPFLAQPPWMGPFYPGVVLFLLPMGRALDLGFLLHMGSFAVGSYALARARGIGRPSAALAALAVGAGTPLSDLARLGYLPETVALSYLPWVLLCLDRGVRGVASAPRSVAGAGLCLGLMHLGGHLVASGALLFGAGLYALALGAAETRRHGTRRPLFRAIALLACSELLGAALAALQLAPLVAAGMESSLSEGRDISGEYHYLTELWRLGSFLFVKLDSVGKGHLFIGVALLPFVSLAARSRARTGRGMTELWVVFLGALLLSLGDATPIWRLLRGLVPPFKIFSYFYFFLVPAALGLALLAAHGFDEWRAEADVAGMDGGVRPVVTSCGVLAGISLLTVFAALREPESASFSQVFVFGSAAWSVIVLVAVASLAGLRSRGFARHAAALRASAPVIVCLLCADLTLFAARHRLAGTPFELDRYFDGGVAFARFPRPGLGRMARVERLRYARDWALLRNEGMIRSYEDVGLDSKLPLARVAALAGRLEGIELDWVKSIAASKHPPEPSRARLRLDAGSRDVRILDLLDVEALATDLPVEGDAYDLGTSRSPSETTAPPGTALLEVWRRAPSPRRFFLAETWKVADSPHDALERALDPEVDPWSEPIVEHLPGPGGGESPSVELRGAASIPSSGSGDSSSREMDQGVGCDSDPASPAPPADTTILATFSFAGGMVSQASWSPGCVDLGVEAVAPSVLVIGEMATPGWKITVDGIAAPAGVANGISLATLVPEGSHRVVARYRPRPFRVGVWMSCLGLSLLAMTAVAAGVIESGRISFTPAGARRRRR